MTDTSLARLEQPEQAQFAAADAGRGWAARARVVGLALPVLAALAVLALVLPGSVGTT